MKNCALQTILKTRKISAGHTKFSKNAEASKVALAVKQ